MIRTFLTALSLGLVTTACTLPALGQCPVSPWGDIGGGAVAGQPYSTSFAIAGMGSKVESIRVPTTGGSSVHASYDIGHEIRKIVAVGASTAWVTDGTSIWAFDQINAAVDPLRLLSVYSPAGGVREMLPLGSMLYAWSGSTLRVIDYSNPGTPVVVSTLNLPVSVTQAAFLNNRLYMLTANGGVTIVDASNQSAPSVLNTLALSANPASVLNSSPYAFSDGGSLVHLAFYSVDFSNNSRSLRIVDLSGDQPTGDSGAVPVSSSIVQIAGDYLIQPQTLARINWSNPLAPVITPVYSESGSRFKSFGTITSGGVTRAHIAAGEGGLLVVNASAGVFQTRHGLSPSAAFESAFAPGNGYLMIADGLGGVRTAALNDSGTLSRSFTFAGGSANPASSDLVDISSGDGFILTSNRAQVQKFDTSNAAFPVYAGSYPTDPTNVVDVAASGLAGLVLRSSGGTGAQLDLIHCSAIPPVLEGSHAFSLTAPFAAKRVRAFGNLGAVVERQRIRLYSFDPAAPLSLAARGVVEVATGELQDVAIADGLMYGLGLGGSLTIYDVNDPDAPAFIGAVPCRPNCTGMALSGDWLGLVGAAGDLTGNIRGTIDFVSITDRTHPRTVSTAPLPAIATNLAVREGPSGPHFAAACGLSGVRLFAAPSAWTPMILKDPVSVTTCPSGTAQFTVTALVAPGSTPQYQWRRHRNGHTEDFPGATSPTLVISQVLPTDTGYTYSCVVSNGCGSAASAPASLDICRVDVNCSGVVSVQDIFDFLALYFAGDSAADFNAEFGVTVQDLFDFLAAYFIGCP